MANPALALYWLKDGGSGQFPVPPLTSILDYQPYPTYVNLFAAAFDLDSNGHVIVSVPDTISGPLKAGDGAQLQAKGIKVVLSIFNNTSKNIGWSTLSYTQNVELVASLAYLIKTYALDGIDIDDEGLGNVPSPENFFNTVSMIRQAFPSIVISNAVYDWQDQQKYLDYPKLSTLITYCATMNYGNSFTGIIGGVQEFAAANIPISKICAGVQAGPAGTSCDNGQFTSVDTSKQVAQWALENCMGVMLFTYSQDIVSFTGCPQHGPYPAPGDHAWQIAISSVLYGA